MLTTTSLVLYLARLFLGGVAIFNGFCVLVNHSPRTSARRGVFSSTRYCDKTLPELPSPGGPTLIWGSSRPIARNLLTWRGACGCGAVATKLLRRGRGLRRDPTASRGCPILANFWPFFTLSSLVLYLARLFLGGVAIFNGFCVLVNHSPRTWQLRQAALNSLFYRSRVQPGAVTSDASWLCIELACLQPPRAARQ